MPFFFPDELSQWGEGTWYGSKPDKVSGFSIDARKIRDGEMFVALHGARDGHDFIGQAFDNGASAALVKVPNSNVNIPQLVVDDPLSAFQGFASTYRKKFKSPIVGITGSCGKTSTKELLALLLGSGSHKTEGNLNNFLGVPLTILQIDNQEHEYSVVEVGINEVGEMEMLSKLASPTHVMITMIGESHLEGLKNVETIAIEKANLFQCTGRSTKAIFHADCLQYQSFSNWVEKDEPRLVLYQGEPTEGELSSDIAFYKIWTETNKIGDPCMLRLWRHGSPVLSIEIPSLSEGMKKNIALSILTAVELGISPEKISERLPQYRPSTLRAASFQGRGRTYYLDCYNSNPSSIRDSLDYFSKKFKGTPNSMRLVAWKNLEKKSENCTVKSVQHFYLNPTIWL